MKIAFDLDDVLADTTNAVLKFHNDTYGTALIRDDFIHYDWSHVFKCTREETYQKFLKFIESAYYDALPPIGGAIDFIRQLQGQHELVVITSRQRELEERTHQWIRRHFPDVFAAVYVTNHPHWARTGVPKTKRQVCDEIQVDVLIEDNLDYAKECVTETRRIFLLNAPWNQGEAPLHVHRVGDWPEILPLLTG